MSVTKVVRQLTIYRRLRRFIKQLTCDHSHTFSYALEGATRVYGDPHGARQCRTSGLLLEGCYICGHVEVQDSRA